MSDKTLRSNDLNGTGVGELLEDCVTIWQSELAALVADREVQEGQQRMIDAWGTQMRAWIAQLDATHRLAGPHAPARPAPAADAPDARDAIIAELLERVAALERRLAGA